MLDPRDDGGRQGDRAIADDDGQGAVAGPSRAVADARVDVPPSGSEPSLSKNGGESDEVLFGDGLSAQAESPGVVEEDVSVEDKKEDLKRSLQLLKVMICMLANGLALISLLLDALLVKQV